VVEGGQDLFQSGVTRGPWELRNAALLLPSVLAREFIFTRNINNFTTKWREREREREKEKEKEGEKEKEKAQRRNMRDMTN